jgi:hypothetical protein
MVYCQYVQDDAVEPIAGSTIIDKGGWKIVVIGGTGLIGSKTVAILRQGATRSSRPRPNAV